jgi:DNA-binding transcriptional regulator LsrR (DeoR family)
MVARSIFDVKPCVSFEREPAQMSTEKGPAMADENGTGPAALVLTATVARRYYLGGESKSDIAATLGLSRFKVARLIDRALATGIVRIEIGSPGEIDLDLSSRLSERYALRHCVVMTTDEDDDETLRRGLGHAAADLLAEIVEPGDVLGLSWARSLMAMRTALTRLPPCDVVQLTGSLSMPSDESPIELVRDVARRSGGESFVFYAPMILPDAATAQVLRTQPEIARVIDVYDKVTKAVVGIGAWRAGLSTVADSLTEPEREAIRARGVRGELSGVQFDADGRPVVTSLTERLIGIDAARLLAVPEVIALAYGTSKTDAVRAAIRGGLVSSLVTHTEMARKLLEDA